MWIKKCRLCSYNDFVIVLCKFYMNKTLEESIWNKIIFVGSKHKLYLIYIPKAVSVPFLTTKLSLWLKIYDNKKIIIMIVIHYTIAKAGSTYGHWHHWVIVTLKGKHFKFKQHSSLSEREIILGMLLCFVPSETRQGAADNVFLKRSD